MMNKGWIVGVVMLCLLMIPGESHGQGMTREKAVVADDNPDRGGRVHRSPDECTEPDLFWNCASEKCVVCVKCPSGHESTARFCGRGLGERGTCVECGAGYYRSEYDNDQACKRCSTCDPDATVVANCSLSADIQCGSCKPGMFYMNGYCVSCQDHPIEGECGTEPTKEIVAMTTGANVTMNGRKNDSPVNETYLGLNKNAVLPRAVEDCMCVGGGFVICLMLCAAYRCIKERKRNTGVANKHEGHPQGIRPESHSSHRCAAARLQSGTSGPPSRRDNDGIELGQPPGPPQRELSDPPEAGGSGDASVQDGHGAAHQERQTVVKKKEDGCGGDEINLQETDLLLNETQRATPFTTLTADASMSDRNPSQQSREPLLARVMGGNRRNSSVGTDDEVTEKADEIMGREANFAAAEVVSKTDSEKYSDNTPIATSVSFEDEISSHCAGRPPISTASKPSYNSRASQPSNQRDIQNSICSDDRFNERSTNVNSSTPLQNSMSNWHPTPKDEEKCTTSNNVAQLVSLRENSTYGSLRSLDDTKFHDDANVAGNTDNVVRRASEVAREYHLQDLDGGIIDRMGLKLNPDNGPAFPNAKELAMGFGIEEDTYNNFKLEYFFQDMIKFLGRKTPGKYTVHHLLDNLITVKRCDVALILAVHVNGGNLKKRCIMCTLHTNEKRTTNNIITDNSGTTENIFNDHSY